MKLNQPALIAAAIGRMGQGRRIVIATDNDPGGCALADQIEAIARGHEGLHLSRDLPEGQGHDWSECRVSLVKPGGYVLCGRGPGE